MIVLIPMFIGRGFAASTVLVTPTDPNGWFFYQETPTGSGTFVYGPSSPPLGGGSAQLTVDGAGGELFGTFAFVGTRLDAITSLAYSTYRSSGSAALAPSLQFDIEIDATTTAWHGRLVYEPYYSHTISTGVWQTWNPQDNASPGNWWFTGAPGNAVCSISTPCTWAGVLAAFPNASIRSAGPNTGTTLFKAGGGWSGGFVGSVDAFSIGVNNVVTTYDFELPFTVPTTISINPSAKLTTNSAFTLTVKGTNFFPSSVVRWNGFDRATTFVSSTQLSASIPSSDLAVANAVPITVVNPTPGGGASNTQTFMVVAPTSSPAYTTWTDKGVGYTAPMGDAYYPSVIYDANGFGVGSTKYAMWYSDGGGLSFVTTSTDGAAWGTPAATMGLANAHHVQVLYDANCFGVVACTATTTKYRVWFWDMGASTIYSISSMATAESVDGIHWINKTALTQNLSAKLVQDPDSGVGWNRGTYGPVSVLYQPNATNVGTEPWNYNYVMYYNGTDGNHEDTGLAYSTDGISWSAYTANPVLSGSGTGGFAAWDCVSAVYGTVFKDLLGYHFFYSGKGYDDGSGGCATPSSFNGIGYASSIDGKTWVKDTNPIFKTDDGVAYRSGRVYTPSVIDDGSGILRMYFSVTDATGSPKKIGYATLPRPSSLPTPPPPSQPSVSGGSKSVLSNISFSGQAYPNSTIKVLQRSDAGIYEGFPTTSHLIGSDGKFQITSQNFFQTNYFFAVQAVDVEGRESRILPLISEFIPSSSNLILKDILIPPTTEVASYLVLPGTPIKIMGYAAPSSVVEIMIDNAIQGRTVATPSGFYVFATSTAKLSFAEHTIKARFILSDKTQSDFSLERVFRVSFAIPSKTDIDGDGIVDINDWSTFLSRWESTDKKLRLSIDLDGDGKADISDLSILLNAIRLR